MTPYIYYPKIELDLDYIRNLILSTLDCRVPGMLNHQRLVANDPYLTSVMEKYPVLSSTYNIYRLSETKPLPIHIDRDRFATLNIPIANTNEAATIFYRPDNVISNHNNGRVYHELVGDFTELYRFIMVEPVILNTKIPHCVDATGTDERISVSWSVRPEYSFDDAVRFFSEYGQG